METSPMQSTVISAKKARREKVGGGSVISVLSCPACKKPYSDPKVLPNCHHVVCKGCIVKLMAKSKDGDEMVCPECFREIDMSSKKLDELQSNVFVEQAAKLIQDANQADELSTKVHGESCPHLGLIKSPVLCGHCNERFCRSCLFHHSERIRIEIAWLGSQFEERWRDSTLKLVENAPKIELKIEDQVKLSEQKIDKSVSELEKSIKLAIEQYRNRLLAKAREVGDLQRQHLRTLLEKSSKPSPDLYGTKIVQLLAGSSLFGCSPKDLWKFYDDILERDKEIFDLEATLCEPLYGHLEFQPDPTIEAALQQIWVSGGQCSLRWKLSDEAHPEKKIPTMAWRLHLAAKTGNLGMLKELLSNLPAPCLPSAVEHKDLNDSGKTVLLQAAENGHAEIVRFLVSEHGSQLMGAKTTSENSTAAHLAALNGHLVTVKLLATFEPEILLIGDSENRNVLNRAAATGKLDVVRYLVEEAKIDLEIADSKQRTPLLTACENAQFSTAEYLIGKGAKIDATVIHRAASGGNADLIRFVSKLRPDLLETPDSNGDFPLDLASSNDRAEAVRCLVCDLSANPERTNAFEENAFHVAVFSGSSSVVKFFKENLPSFVEKTLATELGQNELKLALKLVEDSGNNVNKNDLAALRKVRQKAVKAAKKDSTDSKVENKKKAVESESEDDDDGSSFQIEDSEDSDSD